MIAIPAGVLLAARLLAVGSAQAPDTGRGPLILRDITVIDATGAPAAPHMAVVIEHGRIRAVIPLRELRRVPGARIIESGGLFLIPGLWDMHVHMSSVPVSPTARGPGAVQANSRYFLPLFVSWGVTGVRDMSGTLELLTAWRDSVMRGNLLGPRMLVTGGKLGSPRPAMTGAPYPLRTAADVRQTVHMLQQHGADHIKVAGLPRNLVAPLAEESRRLGISFVGHLPADLSLADASRAGMRSIEHLDGALFAMSTREAELEKRERRWDGWWTRLLVRLHLADPERLRLKLHRDVLASASATRAESLYALLRRQQTWQVPTLSELRDLHRVREPEPFAAEWKDYVPPLRGPIVRVHWDRDPGLGAQEFTRQLEVVGEMFRAGVPLLAGTDAPGPDRIPGFSLAEELELLVRAGLPPMAALQTATREPARFLGIADTLGTVEPGKVADLVLLEGNPLAEIHNVHRVRAVVLRGRYLSPAELDSLRTSVRSLVAAWRDSVARQRPVSSR